MRRAILTTLAILAILAPTASATLNDRYPTNAAGELVIPALETIASTITGQPTSVICSPVDPDNDGWTFAYDDENGVTHVDPVIYLSGERCASLDQLVHYREHRRVFRRDARVYDAGAWTRWPDQATYDASVALAALVHESMHVALQSDDEARVECAMLANLWPTLASLRLPAWLARTITLNVRDNHDELASALPQYGSDCP